jgi:beta-galactosidase
MRTPRPISAFTPPAVAASDYARWLQIACALALVAGLLLHDSAAAATDDTKKGSAAVAETKPLRSVRSLNEGWRFLQHDGLTPEDALRASGADWNTVRLPHTWNADDAASLEARDYKRGVGWYRLAFDSPKAGARHWLEFGAASLVADVWLNGEKLGQHKGGFTQFRFDVTGRLEEKGRNLLVVRVDSTEPQKEDDLTAIAPLGGDFNVSGGLVRHVVLVSTRDPVHIDLGDMGGPGVYARTTSIAGGNAVVQVRSKLKSDARDAGRYVVRASLVERDGKSAQRAEQPVTLQPGARHDVSQTLKVPSARLWQGIEDPYLYKLVVEVVKNGKPIDRVVQSFGIREMRFDANDGFFLNGRDVRLRGVAMHQDILGKAWAVTEKEIEASMELIREIGANAVRLGHYPFPQYALEKASEVGLVAWAETALGLGTTVEPCARYQASKAFVDNAREQLQEMIRQQYNHAAVALWSVGNETSARQAACDDPFDNVRPVLRELHQLAKKEDPARPTAYAEYGHPPDREGVAATEGITDLFATNRYFLWYSEPFAEFSHWLDALHRLAYKQPFGVSEYGAGAAITHHTDNPLGALPDVRSAPPGETSWQPEEYASYAHEQNYRVISGKEYLWGSFAWNMFDFGSAHRNEGDALGVNTKGLVTFDRKTRKDPFFFYKANWSREPVTYITSRRYTDRAYAVTNVTVYSNADSVRLAVNGKTFATKKAHECPMATCVFRDVRLRRGENAVEAEGRHGDKRVTDAVRWALNTDEVNIAAGWVATGYVASDGRRFGSDNFFLGGRGMKIERGAAQPIGPESFAAAGATQFAGTRDPLLYQHLRAGRFGYEIPLENGRYEVMLGFVEPDVKTAAGSRVFDVVANGRRLLEGFDVIEAAGMADSAVTRAFAVDVSHGRLVLDFIPTRGEAVVSVIAIRREGR